MWRSRCGRSCGRRRNACTPWRAIKRRLPNPARAHLLDLVRAADPVQARNVVWEYVQARLLGVLQLVAQGDRRERGTRC